MMTGQKGRSGIGSGGPGRGQGQKRKHVTLELGMTLSISRVSNDGQSVYPAVVGEVIRIGGDSGHESQFIIVTPDETMTFFIDGQPQPGGIKTPGGRNLRRAYSVQFYGGKYVVGSGGENSGSLTLPEAQRQASELNRKAKRQKS